MHTFSTIKGFKDILPDEAPIWQAIEEAAREVARLYNFEELRVPIAEHTEIFARGIGASTDIVEKEMYSFTDKGNEKITMRPEATAGMVRAMLEHNLVEGGRSARLFCLGPMFRYEKPQKARLRQFHQLDMEVFGDPSPQVDAEVLSWLNMFLEKVGLSDLMINLNSLGCPNCRPQYRKLLISFLENRRNELCVDCWRRLELNPLRVIDCKVATCREIVKGAPHMIDHLCAECDEHFKTVLSLLDKLGLRYELNPRLVRGLDYYTRTAFEVHSGDLGAQAAVAGGGRYDGLAKELGGPDVPGIGFAVGLERLVMLMKQKNMVQVKGPDYYIAILDNAAMPVAFKIAQVLRDQGHKAAAEWEVGSLKSRMKRADKCGAAHIIMLGADELANGKATVRDMASGEQNEMDIHAYI